MNAILYQDSGGKSVNGGWQYWDSIKANIQPNTNTIFIKGKVLKKVTLKVSTEIFKTILNLLKFTFKVEKNVEIIRHEIKETESIQVDAPSHWFYEKTDGKYLTPFFLVTPDGRVFMESYGDFEFKVWLKKPYWWIAGWPGDKTGADELYEQFMQSIGLKRKTKPSVF